jgi:hypothetical protein
MPACVTDSGVRVSLIIFNNNYSPNAQWILVKIYRDEVEVNI